MDRISIGDLYMKKINFNKVEMKNFCGYIDPMEFEFENSKITLISGKNGVGKSTVFSAIPFALYGITQTGQTAIDVLNNKTEKNCLVTCYFSIDDVKYIASRGLKSKKAATSAVLYIEGIKEPIAKGAREVTNKIEELIVPKELFLNTVLFGQKVKSFFTDLPDSKQKEIFRKILQLDTYVEYQKTSSEKIKQLDEKLEDINICIHKVDSTIEVLEKNILDIESIVTEKNKDCNNITDNIKLINDQIEKLEEQLRLLEEKETNDSLIKLNNQKTLIDNELENIQLLKTGQINELAAQVKSKISQLNELHSGKINECDNELNCKLNKIKDETNLLLNKINKTISDLREVYLIEKNDLDNQFNTDINALNVLIQDAKNSHRVIIDELKETTRNLNDEENSIVIDRIKYFENNHNDSKEDIRNKTDNNRVTIQSFENDISKEQIIIDLSNENIRKYNLSIAAKTSICPTCQQEWNNVEHIEKMIDDDNLIIEKSKNSINDINIKIQSLIGEIKLFEDDIVKINDIIRDGIADIKENNLKVINQNNETMNKDIICEKQKLVDQLDKLDGDVEKIKKQSSITSTNLDIKFKTIAEGHKKSKVGTEEDLKKQLSNLNIVHTDTMDDLNNRLDKAIKSVLSMESDNLKDINDKFDNMVKSNNVIIKKLNMELMDIKHRLAAIEGVKNKIRKMEDDIKSNNQQFDFTQDSIMISKSSIISINKNISEQKQQIVAYDNTIKDFKKNQEIYHFWKIAFSSAGIPSMLIDESIPFMNRRISEYLEQMSNGRYIVTFDTLHETRSGEFRDKINVNVYDIVTHSNSRVNLSGGQTKLVDIATILTLSDLQENVQKFQTNILLFDEIFDALDDENIANVSNMLRKIIEDKSINIITHRHIDQVEADAVYNFGS